MIILNWLRRSRALGKTSVERAIIVALVAALVMKFFIFDFMIAEGHSMDPAIKPGAVLLVWKVYYGIRLPSILRPGSGNYLVKWRNPKEGDIVVFYTPLGEIAVKRCREILPGSQFKALGDNSSHSYDSRDYGPVTNGNIIGRVLGIK
jgi:signal peptidase I